MAAAATDEPPASKWYQHTCSDSLHAAAAQQPSRAWAQYRPIFGVAVLRYTSLREQYVYKRAAQLYNAAFKSDPGKSVRTLAAWLRHATPMETDASSSGSQPSKRAKKSRGNRVQALPVA